MVKNLFKITFVLLFSSTMIYSQNVGIGTITPDASSILDVTSNSKGFLPPRMTQTQMNAIISPEEGLMVYCTDCVDKGLYMYNGVAYSHLVEDEEMAYATINCAGISPIFTLEHDRPVAGFTTITIPYTGGNGKLYNNISINSEGVLGLTATTSFGRLNNGVGSITFLISGRPMDTGMANFEFSLGTNTCTFSIEIITPSITSVTGRVWMDRNLGATRAAVSNLDVNAYGDLYQWGRNTTGHEKRNSITIEGPLANGDSANFIWTNDAQPLDWLTPSDDTLWNTGTEGSPIKTATDPCPTGYRIPTETEWNAEISSGNIVALNLTLAGNRVGGSGGLGTINDEGVTGEYWSSTSTGTNKTKAMRILADNSTVMFNSSRRSGLSVRCIQE